MARPSIGAIYDATLAQELQRIPIITLAARPSPNRREVPGIEDTDVALASGPAARWASPRTIIVQ